MLLSSIWRIFHHPKRQTGLVLGNIVRDGSESKPKLLISEKRRSQHIAILGKTGSGKSSLLRFLMRQDIEALRGFACIDLHGDLVPFVLSEIESHEQVRGVDLSKRLLVIDPSEKEFAVGLNLIEATSRETRPVQISEVVGLLRKRWNLDHFGARTEELLRNALWVLSENELTLLEMPELLTNALYRQQLLAKVSNPEVTSYFRNRFDKSSEAMQATMREAVLNKVTAFSVDPGIRHIVGQRFSAVSLRSALDQGFWILLSLPKARLGENALTFASLFLAKLKNAIFSRQNKTLFSIYADELPNIAAASDSFETLLSEARKFSLSVVSANQFLGQMSSEMRSALLSVGTILCFTLSSEDAPLMAKALSGGKSLSQKLMSLRSRHFISNLDEYPVEAAVPEVRRSKTLGNTVLKRSLMRFAKPREEIEHEINARRPTQKAAELEEWA